MRLGLFNSGVGGFTVLKKVIELELNLSSRDKALKYAEDMAKKLLVNPTMETYQIILE